MRRQEKVFSLYVCAGALLLSWIFLQSQIRITADAAWLSIAAERFLSGLSMKEYFFETNPPLSIIIYAPVVFLQSAGLELWTALNVYTGVLTGLSIAASFYFLKHRNITPLCRFLVIAGYTATVTIFSLYIYAQRDQLLILALLPFILAQAGLTDNRAGRPFLRVLTFMVCCPFLLVKPQYCLLPAAVLLHRVYKRRSLSVFLSADALTLAAGVALYAAVVFVYFPDYLTVILPASIDLYLGMAARMDIVSHFVVSLTVLTACTAMLAWFSDAQDKTKDDGRALALLLSCMAGLSIIPFWLQNKGFGYHMAPFSGFIVPALLMTACLHSTERTARRMAAGFLTFLMATILMGAYFSQAERHNFMQNDPVAQMIAALPPGESFYIDYISTDSVMPIAVYQHRPFASRFGVAWFLNLALLQDAGKRNGYKDLFGNMMAEDIERNKPALMLLGGYATSYDMPDVFMDLPRFHKALADYKEDGTVRSSHFKMGNDLDSEPVVFRVFRRKGRVAQ